MPGEEGKMVREYKRGGRERRTTEIEGGCNLSTVKEIFPVSVVGPDPFGSELSCWIRIKNLCTERGKQLSRTSISHFCDLGMFCFKTVCHYDL